MLPTNSPLIPPSRRPSLFYGYVLPFFVAAQFFGQPTVYNFLSNPYYPSRGNAFLLVVSIAFVVLCTWARRHALKAGKIAPRSLSTFAYHLLEVLNLLLVLVHLLTLIPSSPMRI